MNFLGMGIFKKTKNTIFPAKAGTQIISAKAEIQTNFLDSPVKQGNVFWFPALSRIRGIGRDDKSFILLSRSATLLILLPTPTRARIIPTHLRPVLTWRWESFGGRAYLRSAAIVA